MRKFSSLPLKKNSIQIKTKSESKKPPQKAFPFFLPNENFTNQHKKALEASPHHILSRDFIHDSLYNPDYGYFSKRALIFSYPKPFQFPEFKNAGAFQEKVAMIYREYDEIAEDLSLQVWHTPTEMFRPFYGHAIANYILNKYKKEIQPKQKPLKIFEIGAGNGTLMKNILEFIKEKDESVFNTLQYHIIEISSELSKKQNLNFYRDRFQIHNQSIFDWNRRIDDECFFISLEVIVSQHD